MKRRNTFGVIAASAAAALFGIPEAAAQDDPTAVGGGKKPYVLIIMDTSGSMEWTDDGDAVFPFYDQDDQSPGSGFQYDDGTTAFGDGDPDTGSGFDPLYDSWKPRDFIYEDPEGVMPDPSAFGPCFVWEPIETRADGNTEDDWKDLCKEYERPAWRGPADSDDFEIAVAPDKWWGWSWGASDPTDMTVRYAAMRGADAASIGFRLQEETQPRHVTLKEVLTGDMILLPLDPGTKFEASDWNADEAGPGCWFVPRQRDASIQPAFDQNFCKGQKEFEDLPEHNSPFPHMQEVYDLQVKNGVLDRLGSNALFAVAAFDSYRDDVDDPEWKPNKLNDDIDGTFPPMTGRRDGNKNEDVTEDCNDDDDAPGCYNLGLWRIVSPTDLQVPSTMLPELSSFAQIVINDHGFLTTQGGGEFELDPDDKKNNEQAFLGSRFPDGFKDYVDKFDLGKQPMARATPLAAAIHDARQFFRLVLDDSHFFNPKNDPFAECRPKHVVMVTDGRPEPEWDDPDFHPNIAFGYDETLYSYHTTEMEIAELVDDPDLKAPDWEPDEVAKYNMRVHVAGLNLDATDDDTVEKMGAMAAEGGSCAGYHLENFISTDDGGTCVPGTGCLVDQSSGDTSGYMYTPPDGESPDAPCEKYPALVLDNNNPDVLSEALFQMFSEIIAASGLASRTKLVVSNRLDDALLSQGGQYRVYSGVKIGGSSWWKGIINRNTILCSDPDNPVAISLDDEVGVQVDLTTERTDSRRVWTAVPDDITYDFTNKEPQDVSTIVGTQPGHNDTYPFSYGLTPLSTDTDDEFAETYMISSTLDTTKLLGTRVPFERLTLDDVYEGGNAVDHMNTGSDTELDSVINTFRARITERVDDDRGGDGIEDRVIGGILNSNPTVVGPPSLDLPIGSYRNFRALYADRPTMLYVSSMDGLLHALHLGRLENRVKVRDYVAENALPTTPDDIGSAADQREAWAYVPFSLHRDLVSNLNGQAYLVDGSPEVKDVRLCNKQAELNQNKQACRSLCAAGDCQIRGDQQWRTVLVQAFGGAGAGYYAMDVTRPGGLFQGDTIEMPDPILLWEFDRDWERAQLEYLFGVNDEKVRVVTDETIVDKKYWDTDECSKDRDQFWQSPMLGTSISHPEIATLIVTDAAGNRAQRPVAVFGGGSNLTGNTECAADVSGMAIYVVDLQSGTLLRRFTHFEDDTGNAVHFGDDLNGDGPSRFVGSPGLYDSATGSVATRGFIGDDKGRLFKMNFSDSDPRSWEVSLFFDPNNKSDNPDLDSLKNDAVGGGADWGPAAFKPAIALNADRDVMVVYGLGEAGDTVTNGQAQAVLALTEQRTNPSVGFLNWAEVFEEGEKITGPPLAFNSVAYFPTYALPVDDSCEPGSARIWGLTLTETDTSSLATTGVFEGNLDIESDPDLQTPLDPDDEGKWFGPIEPTLIRGLTVTLGPMCSVDFTDPNNPDFSQDQPQPQLIAQTSADVSNSLVNPDAATSSTVTNEITRMGLALEPPESQSIPLSWGLISN